MYKFDLSKILCELEDLLNENRVPFYLGRDQMISGGYDSSHKYAIHIISVDNPHGNFRVVIQSDLYTVVMYQMTEPDIMQYVIRNTLIGTGINIHSTEEEMFQNSLTDTEMCTYDDLQRMIRIVQEALDTGTEHLGIPRVKIC